MTQRRGLGPLPFLGGLLALYLLVPIAVLIARLASGSGSSAGGGLWAAVWISVLTATVATAVIALLGIPLASVLAQRRSGLWGAIGVAVQLPLAVPPLMSGILLIEVVGPYTTIGRLFGGRLTDTTAAIVLAQTFVASPFLIVAARSAFETVDPDLLDVAATLGHRGWSRFWRVSLPLAGPGIRAGLVLAWLRAFGEFGATVILAYHPYSLPVFTFVQFSSSGLSTALPATGASLAAAAAVLALARAAPALAGIGARRWRAAPREAPAVGAAWPSPPHRLPPPGRLEFDLDASVGTFALRLAWRCGTTRLAVLGASGAGKSLTLRSLAGLLGPRVGRVTLGPRELSALEPAQRRVGWVPQDGALLPHLGVWRQVNFGVGAEPALAAFWLARLGLAELVDRRPDQLSGGQRQRVALARALALAPDLLLLDEPFASLDTPARRDLRRELRRLQQETGVATVVVTHDPEEAAILADELIVIGAGRALQSGPRDAVFARPNSPEVARMLGIDNLCAGRIGGPRRMTSDRTELTIPETELAAGTSVRWCVRGERIRLLEPREQLEPAYDATLLDAIELGVGWEVTVRLEGGLELLCRTLSAPPLASGAQLRVHVAPDDVTLWRQDPAGHGTSAARVAPHP